MSENSYQLYCCGSRGSRPVEGRRFNEFGGFTSCYVLKKKDYALVIDCGTGLYEANAIVLDCPVIDVVITHMHYDHVLGLLDWEAIPPKSKVTFYSGFDKWYGNKTFEEFFCPPFWPVQPNFTLKNTPAEGSLKLRDDLSIDFYKADHPNESQLMIIKQKEDDSDPENKIIIMFDCEKSDALPLEDIQNCDYLIYDGMYTDNEYASHKGYGHSTWQEGCRLAARANPQRLIITHHDPNRTDIQLRRFESLARDVYPSTDFARSGQIWSFPANVQTEPKRPERKTISKTKTIIEAINEKLDELVLDDANSKKLMALGSYILLGIVSIFMTIVNILTGKDLLMYSTLVFAVLCGINVVIELKSKGGSQLAQTIFQIEMVVLLTFFIVSGTPEGFSALWSLMLPVAGMLVFGRKRNSILCAIMLGIIVFFFDIPLGRNFLQYNYTETFMMRFPMIFIAFYILALFLDTIRVHTLDELQKLRKSQEKTIADQTSELREQNFGMLRINSKLQLRNKILTQTLGKNLSDDQIRDILKENEPENISENNQE